MSAYIPFDLDAEISYGELPPATLATLATLAHETRTMMSNDVELGGEKEADSGLLLSATFATREGKVAESSNRVANFPETGRDAFDGVDIDEEACPETQSSRSSKSSRSEDSDYFFCISTAPEVLSSNLVLF